MRFPTLVINRDPHWPVALIDQWRPDLKHIPGGTFSGRLMSTDPQRKLWANPDYLPVEAIEALPVDACDQSRRQYISWQRIFTEEMKRRHLLWSLAEDDISNGRPEEIVWLKYGIEPGESQEAYVKRALQFNTYAVATPDGWFDRDSIQPSRLWPDVFKAIVNSADPNDWFTIVDCFPGRAVL